MSPIERVCHFTKMEVIECMKCYDVHYDTHNYDTKLSQGEGIINENSLLSKNYNAPTSRLDLLMGQRLKGTSTTVPSSIEGRANDLFRKVHELIGVTNLGDIDEFEMISSGIESLHQSIVQLRKNDNKKDPGEDIQGTVFPGPEHGNKGNSQITKRDRRLRMK